MKKIISIIFVLIFMCCSITGQNTLDYLGQEPPGEVPRLFAPGIVSTGCHDLDIAISPDGKYLLLEKRGPASNGRRGNLDIFISEKTENGWGEPSRLDNGINTENNEGYISMASNGNLYFGADYPQSRGRFDIYMFSPDEEQFNYEQFMKRINGPGNGSQDIYWVSAKIIEDLKPKDLK